MRACCAVRLVHLLGSCRAGGAAGGGCCERRRQAPGPRDGRLLLLRLRLPLGSLCLLLRLRCLRHVLLLPRQRSSSKRRSQPPRPRRRPRLRRCRRRALVLRSPGMAGTWLPVSCLGMRAAGLWGRLVLLLLLATKFWHGCKGRGQAPGARGGAALLPGPLSRAGRACASARLGSATASARASSRVAAACGAAAGRSAVAACGAAAGSGCWQRRRAWCQGQGWRGRCRVDGRAGRHGWRLVADCGSQPDQADRGCYDVGWLVPAAAARLAVHVGRVLDLQPGQEAARNTVRCVFVGLA